MKIDWKVVHLWWGRIRPFLAKNPHVAMACGLIGAGATVLGGQGILLIFASHIFGSQGEWGWAPPVFALLCLVLALLVFLRGVPARPVIHDDSFGFAILDGWSFETAVRAIAQSAEKIVYFESFTEGDLAVPLRPTEFSCSTHLEAIEELHHFAAQAGLPAYNVHESNGVVTVRRDT